MIKVFLIDDHTIVRNGIKLLLESHPDILVVGESGSIEEAILEMKKETPDIILTEMDTTALSNLVKAITENYENTKVAILSAIEDLPLIAKAFEIGVQGYFLKSNDCPELIFGLTQIAIGCKYLDVKVGMNFMAYFKPEESDISKSQYFQQLLDITDRELTILELIAQGMTNEEIGQEIFLSKRTVEGYRKQLMEKTKTKNSAELIRYSFKHYLLQ